jgi:hypothetical protein
MMKKKIYLISFCIMLITGCNEWLYLEPENGIIRQEYWQSKEDVNAAVMGCYASLLGNAQGRGYSVPELMFIWGEIRTDMIVPHRLRSDYLFIYNGDILPDNGVCRWNAFYRTINYCNTVLEFADDVQETDPSFTPEALHNYESEVKAIRALMYFYLVRTFGEVPLKLNATINDNEKFAVPKSPAPVILKQIKSDLANAEKNAVLSYGNIASNKGRITKYTINAIQADVYLWCQQYDSCILACNKIINSGLFGLVENDDFWFSTLYGEGNSSEGIFELQFSQEILNPYYNMLKRNKYFKASAVAVEEFFPADPLLPPDSADIRGDGASYKVSDNYTIWKYVGKDKVTFRTDYESYAHWIVYRYAEILLFKAEAMAQLGMIDDALKLVKTIRKRAHASKLTSMDLEVSDIRSMTDYILTERLREFAFEGKRWYDVLRMARRNNYERIDILIEMVIRSAPADRQITIKNKYLDTLSHYLPIYYTELQANPALIQNEFYGE